MRIALTRWRWPLLLSLAVHALLFLPYNAPPDTAGSAALVLSELRVHLRAGVKPAHAVLPVLPIESSPPPQAVSPMPRAVPVSAPVAALKTEAGAHRLTASRSIARGAPVLAEGAAVQQPVNEREGSGRAPVTPPSHHRPPLWQITPGLDAGALRAYRLAVARSMRMSHWRAALTAQGDGRVSVGVAMHATGQLAAVEVTQGSGRVALDQAVLMAVRRALADVSLPLPLQGKAFVFLLEVEVAAEAETAAARESSVISGVGQ